MTAISIARGFLLRRLFEALHIRRPLSPFMQAVIAERVRQVEVEGWSSEHDDPAAPGRACKQVGCARLELCGILGDEAIRRRGLPAVR